LLVAAIGLEASGGYVRTQFGNGRSEEHSSSGKTMTSRRSFDTSIPPNESIAIFPECNELLIAPKSSAHVSNHEVRHFWSCDNCGHEIELAVNLHFGAKSKPSNRFGAVQSAGQL
jgi:hypothetical protein